VPAFRLIIEFEHGDVVVFSHPKLSVCYARTIGREIPEKFDGGAATGGSSRCRGSALSGKAGRATGIGSSPQEDVVTLTKSNLT
jgi:hypothetical protein